LSGTPVLDQVAPVNAQRGTVKLASFTAVGQYTMRASSVPMARRLMWQKIEPALLLA